MAQTRDGDEQRAGPGSWYDANYYEHHLGRPYRPGDPVWEAFFGRLADAIVAELAPRTALDAGCAHGMLVGALRARGVDARGVDVSEYAIANAPPHVREFCALGSVTDELDRDYDLVVCIEVLEHLDAGEAERAVANLSRHTSSVVFSSTPFDYAEPTHETVRPPDHWVGLFARHGLFRNLDFDLGFVAPQAMHLVRRGQTPVEVARAYERWHWRHRHELHELREALRASERELAALRERVNPAGTLVALARRGARALARRVAGQGRASTDA